MNVETRIVCHLDNDPNQAVECFLETGKRYPVLVIGPVVFFPTDEQLVAVRVAIDRHLNPEHRLGMKQCDLCSGLFDPLEGGQSTADTVICGGCITRLAGRKALLDELPF